MVGGQVDSRILRETLGHYPTGVAVVTAVADSGEPVGMVVGTFSSVSLDPALVAFMPDKRSASFARLQQSQRFCVNVLASDQEELCRRMATGGPHKFENVAWRRAPGGSPILDGCLAWIDCDKHDIIDAGDHYIVLGRVRELAVDRFSLPLIFLQGGYGRFSSVSLMAAPNPDLILATTLAQRFRSDVEQLSSRLQVNCSVLAKIGDDAIQVLVVSQADPSEEQGLGFRGALIPPFGAVFMIDAPPGDIERWLARAPVTDELGVERYELMLENVARTGYSLSLVAAPSMATRRREVTLRYQDSDVLPRYENELKALMAEVVDLYDPEMSTDADYDVHSITVPLRVPVGCPRMALRLSALPPSVSSSRVMGWIEAVRDAADAAASRLAAD